MQALCWVTLTRTGARPPQIDLPFPCLLLLFAFSVEASLPQSLSTPHSTYGALKAQPTTRWSLTSQSLKREQVGSGCLFSSAFSPPRALGLLLFFSLSVLGPGGSQDPGRFCLRAGPFLFVRRQSTSHICMGSYCFILERWGQWRGNAGHKSVTRQIRSTVLRP